MKALFAGLLFISFFQHSFGQVRVQNAGQAGGKPGVQAVGQTADFVEISGKFVTADGQPIPFGNVSLAVDTSKEAGSSVLKVVITDEKGQFQMKAIPAGSYILQFTAVGYQSWRSPGFVLEDKQQVKSFGDLVMVASAKQMDQVVVRAQKPLYQQQTGGMVVNVESSVLTKGSSALEVLERSPGVVIDRQNSDISLNGKNGVTVMLNGKLMRMPVDQLVTLLGSMSADDIEKIELLTTPPAGYDADGSAGIINIVLKKNKKMGTSGSASFTGGYGWGEKGTASLSLAHNTGNVNTYGSYTFLHDKSYSDLYVTGSEDFPPLGGALNVLSVDTTHAVTNSHNATIGLDARLDAKTTIGGSLSYNNIHTSSVSREQQAFTVLPDSLLLFNGTISGINQWKNLLSSVYLEKKIRKGEQLNFDLDWLRYHNDRPNEISSVFSNAKGETAGTNNDTLFSPRQRGYASTTIQVGVVKMDYSKQFSRKVKLEAGLKGTYTRDISESGIQSLLNDEWVDRSGTSNNIVMKEGIGAGYTSVNLQLDSRTSLVGGFRYEYSRTRMNDPVTKENNIDRKLGVLFPSLALTRKIGERSELQLSYSKRISRPSYNDLASFVGYSGPVAAYTGNPLLRPAITNNLKLGYTTHGYSFSVMASRDDHPIAWYQLTENPAGNVLYIIPENLDYRNSLTFQANLPFKIGDWWNMSYGFVGGWRQFKETYTQSPVEMTYFSYSLNFSETFKLPRRFTIELSGWLNSLAYNGTTKNDGFGMMSGGIKKELKENRGTFQLTVADLLRTMRISGYHGELTEEAFATTNHFIYNTETTRSPIFKLTYTRSFGSGILKSQRKQGSGSEDETERVRQN